MTAKPVTTHSLTQPGIAAVVVGSALCVGATEKQAIYIITPCCITTATHNPEITTKCINTGCTAHRSASVSQCNTGSSAATSRQSNRGTIEWVAMVTDSTPIQAFSCTTSPGASGQVVLQCNHKDFTVPTPSQQPGGNAHIYAGIARWCHRRVEVSRKQRQFLSTNNIQVLAPS